MPTDPLDAITLLSGIAAALVAATLLHLLGSRRPGGARVRAAVRAARDGRGRAGNTSAARAGPGERLRAALSGLASRVRVSRSSSGEQTRLLLARAGWYAREAPMVFLAIQVLLPLASTTAAILALYVAPVVDLGSEFSLFTVIEVLVLGAYAPMFVLRRMAAGRQNRLRRALPDTLDLMVICAEAGIGLEATLQRVAREMANTSAAMGQELKITALELGVLPDRRQALENLALRTQVPSITGVTATLIQAERYGTPLAQSLRVLATEFRNDRMMVAEERAAKLPAKLTVPLIVFILPALFIVLLGPAIVKALASIATM